MKQILGGLLVVGLLWGITPAQGEKNRRPDPRYEVLRERTVSGRAYFVDGQRDNVSVLFARDYQSHRYSYVFLLPQNKTLVVPVKGGIWDPVFTSGKLILHEKVKKGEKSLTRVFDARGKLLFKKESKLIEDEPDEGSSKVSISIDRKHLIVYRHLSHETNFSYFNSVFSYDAFDLKTFTFLPLFRFPAKDDPLKLKTPFGITNQWLAYLEKTIDEASVVTQVRLIVKTLQGETVTNFKTDIDSMYEFVPTPWYSLFTTYQFSTPSKWDLWILIGPKGKHMATLRFHSNLHGGHRHTYLLEKGIIVQTRNRVFSYDLQGNKIAERTFGHLWPSWRGKPTRRAYGNLAPLALKVEKGGITNELLLVDLNLDVVHGQSVDFPDVDSSGPIPLPNGHFVFMNAHGPFIYDKEGRILWQKIYNPIHRIGSNRYRVMRLRDAIGGDNGEVSILVEDTVEKKTDLIVLRFHTE